MRVSILALVVLFLIGSVGYADVTVPDRVFLYAKDVCGYPAVPTPCPIRMILTCYAKYTSTWIGTDASTVGSTTRVEVRDSDAASIQLGSTYVVDAAPQRCSGAINVLRYYAVDCGTPPDVDGASFTIMRGPYPVTFTYHYHPGTASVRYIEVTSALGSAYRYDAALYTDEDVAYAIHYLVDIADYTVFGPPHSSPSNVTTTVDGSVVTFLGAQGATVGSGSLFAVSGPTLPVGDTANPQLLNDYLGMTSQLMLAGVSQISGRSIVSLPDSTSLATPIWDSGRKIPPPPPEWLLAAKRKMGR